MVFAFQAHVEIPAPVSFFQYCRNIFLVFQIAGKKAAIAGGHHLSLGIDNEIIAGCGLPAEQLAQVVLADIKAQDAGRIVDIEIVHRPVQRKDILAALVIGTLPEELVQEGLRDVFRILISAVDRQEVVDRIIEGAVFCINIDVVHHLVIQEDGLHSRFKLGYIRVVRILLILVGSCKEAVDLLIGA